MRTGILSLALLGSGARGCLRGFPQRRDVISGALVEEDISKFSIVREAHPRDVRSLDAAVEPKTGTAPKAMEIMEIYRQRVEGRNALKAACRLESEFARCNSRIGFRSALTLEECLVKGGKQISDRCVKGIEEWKSVLAETSRAGARYPGSLLEEDFDEVDKSLHDAVVFPHEGLKEQFGHHHDKHGPHGSIRPPPHDHEYQHSHDHHHGHDHHHDHEHGPFPGRRPRGPHGPPPHGHHPPRSSFGVLMEWMFGKPEDSSSDSSEEPSLGSSDSSSDSFDSEVLARLDGRFHSRPRPPLHMNDGRHPPDLAQRFEGGRGDLSAPLREHRGISFHDHGLKHGDHLRYRNRLPDEFEDSHFGGGSDVVETALAFFFFVGAFTLILLPFFLMGRAIKLMVRNARRSNAVVSFGRVDVAAADGYQTLPEDSGDEVGNGTNSYSDGGGDGDDAIVVTGTPVNPPPSVSV